MPNPSTSANPRSRRSACDRCRAYKLRCQRDERPNEPCDRCLKAHLVCTTTFEPTSQRQNRCSHVHSNDGGGRPENNRPRELHLPSPERANTSPPPSSGQASTKDSGYGSRLPSVILPSPARREYARDTVTPSTIEETRAHPARWSTISPTRRELEDTGDAMPLDQEEQLVRSTACIGVSNWSRVDAVVSLGRAWMGWTSRCRAWGSTRKTCRH